MSEEKKLTGYPSIDKPWLKYYTEEQINAPLPHMTAYEYLKSQNADRLDYTAIDSEIGCFTYGELFAQIDATAKALWAIGIQKGKHVLSMFPVLPHESFLFYGIDAVGAALCQIAPLYTPAEVCNFANRVDADLFFVFDFILTPQMEQMVYETTKVRHIIVVNFTPLQGRDERTIAWDAFIAMGREIILPEIHRDPAGDVLMLGCTSGSTGVPKCVMLSDNCFNIAVHQYLNCAIEYIPGDSMLRVAPAFIVSAAVAAHHLPLCAGLRTIYVNHPQTVDEFAELVLTKRPNHSIITAAILDSFETNEKMIGQDLSFIKVTGCGGVSITRNFEERVSHFYNKHNIHSFLGYSWGSSECAACGANRTSFETTCIGTSGAPMVNTTIAAFDLDTCMELTYNKIGELCIQSPNIMTGYYGNEELTKKALRTHADGSVWLHTGDLGSIDENGLVTVRGRTVRMLLIAPMTKLYPQALENEVSAIPGVQSAVFCGIPDPDHDGFVLPVCHIVPEDMDKAEEIKAAVERFCAMKFPEDSRPKRVFIKDHIPLNKGNKPDILLLEKEAAEAMAGECASQT